MLRGVLQNQLVVFQLIARERYECMLKQMGVECRTGDKGYKRSRKFYKRSSYLMSRIKTALGNEDIIVGQMVLNKECLRLGPYYQLALGTTATRRCWTWLFVYACILVEYSL